MAPEPPDDVRRKQEEAAALRAEDRRKIIGAGPGRAGLAAYEVILILLAVFGAALAVEGIDDWTQWLIVGTIMLILLAMLLNLNRRRAA